MTSTAHPRDFRQYRYWLALCTVAAAIAITGCTDSTEGPIYTNLSPGAPWPLAHLVKRCDAQATYTVAVERLTSEDYLQRVHQDDIEIAKKLLYPEGHPQAGNFVPMEKWEIGQAAAWEKFWTIPVNMAELAPFVYQQLTVELSADDFLDRVHDGAIKAASDLLYPADHPQAGEFIPVAEWEYRQSSAWEFYLATRPAGYSCPW